MLPTRYRRLWRRRLRRRPLLPFLLLATLAVDLAMLFTSSGDLDNPFLGGLLGGQIALLAVWVTHQRRGSLARGFVSLVILLVAMQWTFGLPLEESVETGGAVVEDSIFILRSDLRPTYYAVISAMAALATLSAWALRAVCAKGMRTSELQPRVRFQISSILWATLIVAALLSFGRRGAWPVLFEAEGLILLVMFEVTPIVALLPIALLTVRNTDRALWLVAVPCLALLLSLSFWADGYPAYFTTYAAFFGGWLYLCGDRGPVQTPAPRQEPIETPPDSIDLRA